MSGHYALVQRAAEFLRGRLGGLPDVGLVLGSGLGDFTGGMGQAVSIPYGEIPGWPASVVVGHAGTLVAGTVGAKPIIALSGRAHYYEGHSMQVATFATRVLGLLGVRTLILTNAAGGINVTFKPGTLMVIDDHINLMGTNPLVGSERGSIRSALSRHDRGVLEALAAHCRRSGPNARLAIAHGVYVAVHGPSYETPAEIRYLRTIGADAVGMSTVPETIVARHMGMEVIGISCITNPAAGVLPQPLVHDDVMAVARRVRGEFSSLLEAIIEGL